MKNNYPVVIIGAGAAGIGAAHAAQRAGLDYIVLEAAHRTGGRALTEELSPGVPWDLGCHWLHSGSINPLAEIADQLKHRYFTTTPSVGFFMNGSRLTQPEEKQYSQFCDDVWKQIDALRVSGNDSATEQIWFEHDWQPMGTRITAYWQSLMTSADID